MTKIKLYILFIVFFILINFVTAHKYIINVMPSNITIPINLNITNKTVYIYGNHSEFIFNNSYNKSNFNIKLMVKNKNYGFYTYSIKYNYTNNSTLSTINYNVNYTLNTNTKLKVYNNSYYIKYDTDYLPYSNYINSNISYFKNTTINILCTTNFLKCPNKVFMTSNLTQFRLNISIPKETYAGDYNDIVTLIYENQTQLINIKYSLIRNRKYVTVGNMSIEQCVRDTNLSIEECIEYLVQFKGTTVKNNTIYVNHSIENWIPILYLDPNATLDIYNNTLKINDYMTREKIVLENQLNDYMYKYNNASLEVYNMKEEKRQMLEDFRHEKAVAVNETIDRMMIERVHKAYLYLTFIILSCLAIFTIYYYIPEEGYTRFF